ncbi:MAG: DMT family transporter [Alphaproteobacteria bacterium]
MWVAATPAIFVVLWSTGFIGGRMGMPHAEPGTFLIVRFLPVIAIFAVVGLIMRAPWPRGAQWLHIAVAGILVHGFYLGGVFFAISRGMPAGLSALIVGVQPLLTACLVGPLMGERIRPVQWLGFVLGFAGVLLVLEQKLSFAGAGIEALAFNVGALLGITFGTLYQKRHCASMDLRTGSVVQYIAAALFILPWALALERFHIDWTRDFLVAYVWLVLVLSVGTVTLLWVLVRRGAASKVASLFYLVPPCTALFAWLLFDETLGWLAIAGMALTMIGVALVNRQPASR